MPTNHPRGTEATALWLAPTITLEIAVRTVGDTTILDLANTLTWDRSAEKFRRKIWELLDTGVRDFAINMDHLSYVDSTGLGALLVAHSSIRGAGGTCRFYAAHERVRQSLNRVHLDKVFLLLDDEAAAVSRC